jgi:hypothetical protein
MPTPHLMREAPRVRSLSQSTSSRRQLLSFFSFYISSTEVEYNAIGYYNVLSIDSTGYRALSVIQILEHILGGACGSPDPHPPALKPCEFFDLIGGSSDGGVLALFLGRLRMSCEEARMAYLRLGKALFEDAGADEVRLAENGRAKFASELERIIDDKMKEVERPAALDVDQETRGIFCHVSVLFRN